jgi:hypothetical protein
LALQNPGQHANLQGDSGGQQQKQGQGTHGSSNFFGSISADLGAQYLFTEAQDSCIKEIVDSEDSPVMNSPHDSLGKLEESNPRVFVLNQQLQIIKTLWLVALQSS